MKDLITYDIGSKLNAGQVFENVTRALPSFDWRRGDSDAQGPYISGTNDELIQVKLWLGEAPIQMSVSFRRAWPDATDRENRKQQLIESIIKNLIPSIGTIVKMDA
jgi:hypothetical protein